MDGKHINIALLSSFTARPIKTALDTACKAAGISCATYLGGYNQYAQEILDPQSGLYEAKPDLVILFMDTRALLGEHFFVPYGISNEARKEFAQEKFQEIAALIENIKNNSLAKVLLHNFEIPTYSPMGILENKQTFGFVEAIEMLNGKLREQFKNDSRVFLFDYERFCARIGKERLFDHKMYYLGDIKLNAQGSAALAKEYIGYVKAFMARTKKCLVLDCDNTLWGGILGEDGIGGIRLGPTPEGRPFLEFQKFILSMFQRGVILALNSKNNHDDVIKALREHPHMVLREDNFAATRINWEDKVSNMRALAEELNLGIESFVFMDDDRMNREMMKQMLPEISVIELPEDPALYVKTISELDEFNAFALTDEDRERGRMYAVEKARKAARSIANDLNEYLRNLETVVTIDRANSMTVSRIAQLTQKTNQFNMTTRRYTQEQIAELAGRDDFLVVSLSARDRLGDNGIIGVAIVEKVNEMWRIDTFLLSCRVIGRRIEETLLAYLVNHAVQEGAKKLIGEFIATKKNFPAKDFYKKNGFIRSSNSDETELWQYDLSKVYLYPDLIKLA